MAELTRLASDPEQMRAVMDVAFQHNNQNRMSANGVATASLSPANQNMFGGVGSATATGSRAISSSASANNGAMQNNTNGNGTNDADQTEEEMIAEAIRRSLEEGRGP